MKFIQLLKSEQNSTVEQVENAIFNSIKTSLLPYLVQKLNDSNITTDMLTLYVNEWNATITAAVADDENSFEKSSKPTETSLKTTIDTSNTNFISKVTTHFNSPIKNSDKITKESLSKLKIYELRDMCKNLRLIQSGTKETLVNRVYYMTVTDD